MGAKTGILRSRRRRAAYQRLNATGHPGNEIPRRIVLKSQVPPVGSRTPAKPIRLLRRNAIRAIRQIYWVDVK